jgi:hypothetical protein
MYGFRATFGTQRLGFPRLGEESVNHPFSIVCEGGSSLADP